jgi:N-acetylglutamate synthase-like GNAT family acetyltransferase
MTITYRGATDSDLAWVNSRYEEVNFMPSTDLTQDFLMIAESNGTRVGVGRLVTMSKFDCELGGMYISEGFRGMNIADQIIKHLIAEAQKRFETIYCIPLPGLESIYIKRGFEKSEKEFSSLPEKLREKYSYCEKSFGSRVLLVQKTK